MKRTLLFLLLFSFVVGCTVEQSQNVEQAQNIAPTANPPATALPATPTTDYGDVDEAPPATPAPILPEKAAISFIINVHDILNIDDSADTLHQLINLFERYGVQGEFYVTGPMTHLYLEQRPDIVSRLRDSGMTISYHSRPPSPTYAGFDGRLQGLDGAQLAQTLSDYEQYRLDLETGDLIYEEAGGYAFVRDVFGRAPVVASISQQRYRAVGLPIMADLGAQMTVTYHEVGTDVERPYQWVDGLLTRPSDFSITDWQSKDAPRVSPWWNMLRSPIADQYNPTAYLQTRLAEWQSSRAPFITVLIHENNFYRAHATPYAEIFWTDRSKDTPLSPPFDLNGADASDPRNLQDIELIWEAYEELIAYAAANLDVVTSEDVVAMASGENPSASSEAASPANTETPIPLLPTADGEPLLFTMMVHMESNFTDDTDEAIFLRHVEGLRRGMDWFEAYDAKMTIESEKPFAQAQQIWGINLMAEAVTRGHGVGTHCDIGFHLPHMNVVKFAELLAENKAMVDALVGAENNRGCSGAGGKNDWARAAVIAGFQYVNGIVGMHYLAMPLENRPDTTWTDDYIYSAGFHEAAPFDLYDRTHPFMVNTALDFVPDEDGQLLVSAGGIGRLDSMAEGLDYTCEMCLLTNEDSDVLVERIMEVAALHDGSQLGKITVYLPMSNFQPENEAAMIYFLQTIQQLEADGVIQWATQGDVLDRYLAE